MDIIRTQSLCLCTFLGFEDFNSCDMIHKARPNANCVLLAGNIGILSPNVKENIMQLLILKSFETKKASLRLELICW